jgi:hypothetical protein
MKRRSIVSSRIGIGIIVLVSLSACLSSNNSGAKKPSSKDSGKTNPEIALDELDIDLLSNASFSGDTLLLRVEDCEGSKRIRYSVSGGAESTIACSSTDDFLRIDISALEAGNLTANFKLQTQNNSSWTSTHEGSISFTKVDCSPAMESASPFAGGDGSSGNPYLICSETQLKNVDQQPSSHFLLMKNLNLSPWNETKQISNSDSETAFSGTFDGNGHTLGHFEFPNAGDLNVPVGLFGKLGGATIKNLDISLIAPGSGEFSTRFVNGGTSTKGTGVLAAQATNVTISVLRLINNGNRGVYALNGSGGVVGLGSGTIEDVFSDVPVAGPSSSSSGGRGGFADGFGGTFRRVTIKADVENEFLAAGFVAQPNGNLTFENCHYEGDITATGASAGAFAAENNSSSVTITILDSSAKANVRGTNNTGGLLGLQMGPAVIRTSSFEGIIEGTSYVGGLAGYASESNESSSNIVTATITASGDYVGGLWGEARTTSLVASTRIDADITGNSFLGGIAGQMDSILSLEKSSFAGRVIATSGQVGGLSAYCSSVTVSETQFLIERLEGMGRVGGTCAEYYGGGGFTNVLVKIDELVDTNPGNSSVGGLFGEASAGSEVLQKILLVGDLPTPSTIYEGIFSGSNFNVVTSLSHFSSENGGAGSLTSGQLANQSTFTSWDFSGIWLMDAGVGHPTLRRIPRSHR